MTHEETKLNRRDVMRRGAIATGALVAGGTALSGSAVARVADCEVILEPVTVESCSPVDVEVTGGEIKATGTLDSGKTCDDVKNDLFVVREAALQSCEVCSVQQNLGAKTTYLTSSACGGSPHLDDTSFLCVAGQTLTERTQVYRVKDAYTCPTVEVEDISFRGCSEVWIAFDAFPVDSTTAEVNIDGNWQTITIYKSDLTKIPGQYGHDTPVFKYKVGEGEKLIGVKIAGVTEGNDHPCAKNVNNRTS